MNLLRQQKSQTDKLVCDFGFELIWFLEDAYEQKDIRNFLSKLSVDFRKGFLKFKNHLEKKFSQNEQSNLYLHFLSKKENSSTNIYSYSICWAKRIRKQNNIYWKMYFGKATIVLKKYFKNNDTSFLVYDISGDNPFE